MPFCSSFQYTCFISRYAIVCHRNRFQPGNGFRVRDGLRDGFRDGNRDGNRPRLRIKLRFRTLSWAGLYL